MPPLPWKSFVTPDPDSEYVVMASSLPLLRLIATLRFFRFVRAIRAQLAGSGGLVGYSLWAKPLKKRYWTLSVWRDEAALASFMNAMPHVEVMTKLGPDMGETRFVRWHVRGAETQVAWDEALRRLDAAVAVPHESSPVVAPMSDGPTPE
jgi:hypothetical protein